MKLLRYLNRSSSTSQTLTPLCGRCHLEHGDFLLSIRNKRHFVRHGASICQGLHTATRSTENSAGKSGLNNNNTPSLTRTGYLGGRADTASRFINATRKFQTNAWDSERDESGRENIFSNKNFDDPLFGVLSEGNEKVSLGKMLAKYKQRLKTAGLWQNDLRLKESMQRIRAAQMGQSPYLEGKEVVLDRDAFYDLVKENIVLIRRAFTDDFVIPDFPKFCSAIDDIYWRCRTNTDGKVASYIPQLSRYSSDYWGVSVCTIDGQRHSIGDVRVPFSIQSCSKPVNYALALNELGHDVVHQYIGHEPSGESFNTIKLTNDNKPHNPMINAGAIVIASLIQNNFRLADRFDYISKQYKRLCGDDYLSFNNAIFLSERETADRNFALAYYMKENKCFPDGMNLHETMDFYFHLCSLEVNCESGAVIAATLANGGICPVSDEYVLDPPSIRNTLSLMHSCGMYDYSGEFAFKVGLPAKSGVSGVILLVIPNVCGMCIWSPPLDKCGNSVRGIQFSEELVNIFNFHHYDNLKHTSQKEDPRIRKTDVQGAEIVTLLFGASNGDLSALKRIALAGKDMATADYDGRTALHLAAAEGHIECVKYLLEECQVPPYPKDRWGHTPMDDAVEFKHTQVQEYLRKYDTTHAPTTPTMVGALAPIPKSGEDTTDSDTTSSNTTSSDLKRDEATGSDKSGDVN